MLTTDPTPFDTQEMGEAMAPASGRKTSGGSIPDAGAALVCLSLLLVFVACGEPTPAPPRDQPAPPPAHVAAFVATPPALAPGANRYWHAYLDDVLGDDGGGRAGYEAAYAAAPTEPAIGARAALHLADREATAGNRRRALELVARATQLAPDDDGIRDAAERLQAGLAAAPAGSGAADEVRGPPLGTPIAGASPQVAADFAAAEKLLARAHRIRMEPALESLSSTVKAKERATDEAVAAFKAIADAGGLAAVAAEFRSASLYHDLAVELVFDLPPELDPAVASRLRRTLGDSARAYLRKAEAAYRRALAIDARGDDAELWRAAAETNLRAAGELLGEK